LGHAVPGACIILNGAACFFAPESGMGIWSASAICRYYLNPSIKLLEPGSRASGGPPAAGYYIVRHWDSDRPRASDGASEHDLGPFSSRVNARNWSRKYLAEPEATPPGTYSNRS
jgi:hypothetical protein